AASATGYVDYLFNQDGVVRNMPLWIEYQQRLYPQAGLSLACAMLGIRPEDPNAVKISADAVTLLPPNRAPIVIPVRSIYAPRLGRLAGAMLDIPWFGPSGDW